MVFIRLFTVFVPIKPLPEKIVDFSNIHLIFTYSHTLYLHFVPLFYFITYYYTIMLIYDVLCESSRGEREKCGHLLHRWKYLTCPHTCLYYIPFLLPLNNQRTENTFTTTVNRRRAEGDESANRSRLKRTQCNNNGGRVVFPWCVFQMRLLLRVVYSNFTHMCVCGNVMCTK